MPKASRHNQSVEVSIMFEPHRRQDALLREAYVQLLPERKRQMAQKWWSGGCEDGSGEGGERKRA